MHVGSCWKCVGTTCWGIIHPKGPKRVRLSTPIQQDAMYKFLQDYQGLVTTLPEEAMGELVEEENHGPGLE